jgi:hypothetical protein
MINAIVRTDRVAVAVLAGCRAAHETSGIGPLRMQSLSGASAPRPGRSVAGTSDPGRRHVAKVKAGRPVGGEVKAIGRRPACEDRSRTPKHPATLPQLCALGELSDVPRPRGFKFRVGKDAGIAEAHQPLELG